MFLFAARVSSSGIPREQVQHYVRYRHGSFVLLLVWWPLILLLITFRKVEGPFYSFLIYGVTSECRFNLLFLNKSAHSYLKKELDYLLKAIQLAVDAID